MKMYCSCGHVGWEGGEVEGKFFSENEASLVTQLFIIHILFSHTNNVIVMYRHSLGSGPSSFSGYGVAG